MEIREAEEKDLMGLLELYTQLHNNPMPEMGTILNDLWMGMLNDAGHHVIVGIIADKIVSSCVLSVIPNLTHSQRPYGLIENVITDKNHRKKGYATAILNYAKALAQEKNCYKIMLLTGAKEESTLKFYEQAGYNPNDKTAFIQWLE